MNEIHYEFPGEVKFQSYAEIEDRITSFPTHRVIGRDQTDTYNIYEFTLGDETKPVLMITAAMHGSEWQGADYTMSFAEQLRNDTFPDKNFRNFLLENFLISFMPVMNPWGFDNTTEFAITQGRFTASGVDMNADFYEFTQQETRIAVDVMNARAPFAYLDVHMIRGANRAINLIVGNGQYETIGIRDTWARVWAQFAGEPVERWSPFNNLQMGLSRRYMRDQPNGYTPYTLSYITELVRPVNETAGFHRSLSDRQIHANGMASIYIFLRTSVDYYFEHNFGGPPEQRENIKGFYLRDYEGEEYPLLATKTHNSELNGQDDLKITIHQQKNNSLNLLDISELWELHYDEVEYKIVHINERTKGNSFFLEIRAIPLFYWEMDKSIVHEVMDGSYPANRAFQMIFEGTRFNYTIVDFSESISIEGFGGGESRLEMFKRLIDRYNYEFYIQGSTIYLRHLVGNDTNFMYKYKLNASNVRRSTDATSYFTHIKGFGDFEEGEEDYYNNAGLKLEYTSPLADILGVWEGPPIVDGRMTQQSTLDAAMKKAVEESLQVTVEGTLHDIREMGYAEAVPLKGDRVFLIDERIGLDQEIRVQQVTTTYDEKDNVIDCEVTFGNENIRKRHKSNINSAAKLFDGREKLPFNALDTMSQKMIGKIQSVDSELLLQNGIFAIEKNNPNNMVGLNSAGVFISTDGGASARTVMTAEGIVADSVTTGTLRGILLESLNNNTSFNLNSGHLHMENADFTLGGGAKINFDSPGNSILYSRYDSQSGYARVAGLGVGNSLDDRLPFTYLGTYAGATMDTLGPHFSGLFVNTTTRIRDNDAANTMVGQRFRLVSNNDYDKGIDFNFFNNEILTHGANINLGGQGQGFNRGYINRIESGLDAFTINHEYSGSSLGYRFDLTTDGTPGSNATFRGQYAGDLFYNLGTSYHVFRHGWINVLHANDVRTDSLRKFKENEVPLDIEDALEYVRNTEVTTYHYKRDKEQNEANDQRSLYDKKVGIIYDDIKMQRDWLVKADEQSLEFKNIVFLNQKVLQNLLNRIEVLENGT